MADKNFSIDNILGELRGGLNARGVTDITDDEIKKYSMELKKYDTRSLLREVNMTLEDANRPASTPTVSFDSAPSIKSNTDAEYDFDRAEHAKSADDKVLPNFDSIQSSDSADFAQEHQAYRQNTSDKFRNQTAVDDAQAQQFTKEHEEAQRQASHPIAFAKNTLETSNKQSPPYDDYDEYSHVEDRNSSPIGIYQSSSEKSAPILSEEQLAHEQELERQRLRELMLSTAHLKYISLRKNREKMVQDFVLKPQFTVTQPVEVHKEIRRQNPQQTTKKEASKSDGSTPQSAKKASSSHKSSDTSPRIHPTKPSKAGTAPTQAKPTIMDRITALLDKFFPETKDDEIEENFDIQNDTESTESDDSNTKPIISFYKKKTSLNNLGVAEDSRGSFSEYTAENQKTPILHGLRAVEGRLKIRSIVLGVLFVLSVAISGLSGLKDGSPFLFMDKVDNPFGYCFINLILLIGGIALCFDTISDGIISLVKRSPGQNTFYSVAMAFAVLHNALMLLKPTAVTEVAVTLYTSLALLCCIFGLLGRLFNAKTIITNFKFVSDDKEKYAVDVLKNARLAEDFTKGALQEDPNLVYNKKTPFLAGFMDESFKQDKGDQFAKKLLPILSGVALLVAIISLIRGGSIFVALTVISGILLVGSGVVSALMTSLPLYKCSKSLPNIGGAVLGCGGVEEFADANSVLLNASQIFYGKDVTLYGIRTFSDVSIDRVILDATCVLCESKSILGNVFYNMIANPKDALDPIDGVIYEDGMGISAWVGGRRVLIGSRELMTNHNVHVPNSDYEDKYAARDRSLVYLSTAGELSAVFVIGLECSLDIRNMITALYNNDIVCIVKTVDPILTRPALARVFNMPEEAFRVIPSRLHKEFTDISNSDKPVRTAVCNTGTLASYVYSFLGAKRINKIVHWGVLLNYLTLGVGVLLFFMFACLGGLAQLTSFVLCLYELICVVIYIIMQRFNKL